MIAVVEEERQRAEKLFGTADALREVLSSPRTNEEQIENDQFMAQLRATLTEADFNALWAERRSMTMEQAIQMAVS